MKKKSEKACFFSESMFSILLQIKLLSLFIIASCVSASASTYSQITKFTLEFNDERVKDVFDYIEQNSEFIILYNEKYVDIDRKVTVKVNDETVESIFNQIFLGTRNSFKIYGRQVVIILKSEVSFLETPFVFDKIKRVDEELEQPRTKRITGTVLDGIGHPLVGVSIVVKGTTIGTITDIRGNFSIEVPLDAQALIFSYIGMKTQEIDISDKVTLNIVMEEELVGMEEVVVVGYGTQKKESVVGAISQAEGEQIRQNVQGGDLGNALSGSVPGLISFRTTGRPGGADFFVTDYFDTPSANYSTLFIRGKKTWNDAQPLVLVDGVERDFRQINPYEIERISVLKDASATAVFGVKGANGVILITTTRGEEGKPKLTFDVTNTVKYLSRHKDMPARAVPALTAYNYALMNELAISPTSWGFIRPQRWIELTKSQTYPYYLPDVDWRDAILRDFTTDYNANVTLSGGTKFVKYFGALGFLEENDILDIKDIGQGFNPSNKFDRVNFRSNFDFNITPTTMFSVNISGNYFNQIINRESTQAYRAIWMLSSDLMPIKFPDGTWGSPRNISNVVNSVRDFHYGGYHQAKGTNVNTDFILDKKLDLITRGLSANVKLSYDYRDLSTGGVTGDYPQEKSILRDIVDAIEPGMTEAEIKELEKAYTFWPPNPVYHTYDWSMDENYYYREAAEAGHTYRSLFYQISLNYARDFGKHAITGLALMSRQESATGSVFAQYREDWVGRATYAYDRRYLLELNAAYNGSEKFAKKNRFGFFPSIAVGWVISNEEFFNNLKPIISNFKIRISDGVVGSDAGIARWLYTSTWVVQPYSGGSYSFGFGAPYTVDSFPLRYEGNIANPDIHWEVSHKRDFGIETGFLSNKLNFSFDYFIEKRSDVFITGEQRKIPNFFGAPPVSSNLGKVDVHGWELEAQYRQVTSRGLTYWISYAWSLAKDKVIYRETPELTPYYQKAEGYQMDQRRAYLFNQGKMETWNDVYANTAQRVNSTNRLPGDFGIVDFNSNGVIDADDQAPFSYSSRPQYTYAPAIGASYKNWSVSMRLFGVYNVVGTGGYTTSWWENAQLEPVISTWYIKESWSPERGNYETAIRPQLRGLTGMVANLTPFVERSAAYLRCDNADISYSLNRSNAAFVQKIGVNNLKIILSGNNLFLISKRRTDMDAYGGVVWYSDSRIYPVLRRVNIGISVDF